jgi:Zn-dependent metalloprotease
MQTDACSGRNTMPCFIPPNLLKTVAQRGDAEVRDWAVDVLTDAAHTRGHREGVSSTAAARVDVRSRRLSRTVYSAGNHRLLPGDLVRSEKDAAVDDIAVNEAFDGAGKTYAFFDQTLRRNSIDNEGLPIDSTVHYGRRYANAFWNGRQMIYGDGDGRLFGRFTGALEVIAHELTHGLIQYTAALPYEGEGGALNEHFADVFGVLVRQYSLGQTARNADWVLGRGIFTTAVRGSGIRSMSAPGTAYDDPLVGKDQQPAHMRDYIATGDDDGGVHVNCGIPNKAFHTLAIALGGHAWEAPGRIWYVTLCNRMSSSSTFQDCADATYAVAIDLYGRNSRVPRAVRAAWKSVGIVASVRSAKMPADPATPRLRAVAEQSGRSASIAIGEEAGVRPENYVKNWRNA